MVDFTKVKFVDNRHSVKDPVRYPKVINGFEDKSKRAFTESTKLELEHLFTKMKEFINS